MRALSRAQIDALQGLIPSDLLELLGTEHPPASVIDESCTQIQNALDRIMPFVPVPVSSVSPDQALPGGVLSLSGTILIARLTGLHSHSWRGESAREQSELLSAAADQVLATLFAEIYRYGGGVVSFSADGITAFFDGRKLRTDHAALAVAAALAMQEHMMARPALESADLRSGVSVRLALHTGRVFAAVVGDASHADIVIGGHAAKRAERLIVGADAGEILASDEILAICNGLHARPKLVGAHRVERLARIPSMIVPAQAAGYQGITRLRRLAERLAQCKPYLPYGLPLRLLTGAAGGGEFRPVTALFARCQPLSRLMGLLELAALDDPSVIGQALNAYYSGVQRVIHHYDGSIAEIATTGGAVCLLALFGAPLLHEDDPIRAVRAALEIDAALHDISQSVAGLLRAWVGDDPARQWLLKTAQVALWQQVGISRGDVFAGIIGSAERRRYAAIGETIEIAPRLLSGSGAGILLSSSVARAVRHVVATQPLTALTGEDLPWPVPRYQVLSNREGEQRATRMMRHDTLLIGRDIELAQLLRFARAALQAEDAAQRVVVVTGDPGCGKSRLVEEMFHPLYLAIPTVRLHHLHCHSYERTTPYLVAARLVQQILGLQEGQDRAAQAAALLQQFDDLAPAWSRFAPLIGSLLGLPIAETELTSSLSPGERHDRLLDVIALLFRAITARRPLAIVVDDLQWLDVSSQELLAHLATELRDDPFLLLLITRSAPASGEAWRAWAGDAIVHVKQLDRQSSEALLADLLEDEPPPEVRLIIDQAHGIPYFIEEMVRYLQDAGVVQRTADGRWICTQPLSRLAAPLQIEQLLMARLTRLPAEARATLEVIAVIGQHCTPTLLADVSEQGAALPGILELLLAESILIEAPGATGPVYQFRQGIMREVTYDSISFARRRMLHARVAAALERLPPAELDDERVVVAEHYVQAGLGAAAVPHLIQAADRACARYANGEALMLYRRAIGIAEAEGAPNEVVDLEGLSRLYQQIGDTLALTGDFQGARDAYQWYLDRAGQERSPEGWLRSAALWRRIGATFEQQGDLDQALECYMETARCVELVHPLEAAALERARMLSDMGWVAFRRSALDQARRHLEDALALIGGRGSYEDEARILNRLGGLAWSNGDLVAAEHYVRQALEAHERSGNLVGQARALNNLGNLNGCQGNLVLAIDYGLQAVAIDERVGNRRDLAVSANNLGWSLFDAGSYAQAHRSFLQALDLAVAVQDLYVQVQVLLNLGRVLTRLNRPIEAARNLHQSAELARQLQLAPEQLECHVALAELWLSQGDEAQARKAYREALGFVGDHATEEYGRLRRLEAAIARLDGDHERAAALLAEAETIFRQLPNVPEANRTRALMQGAS